jgi:PAS domain S-box-containing protein
VSELKGNIANFYKSILYNSSDVFAVLDEEGIIKFKSDSLKRVFGYNPEELIGREGNTLIHPDDIPTVGEALGKSIEKANTPIPFSVRYRHKEGHYKWVEGTVLNALADPDITGFIVNYRDVTEKYEMIAHLTESEKHLNLALKGGDLGIWDWDLVNDKVFYNQQWAAMLDYTLEEINGDPNFWERILHPDDSERVTSSLMAHIKGEQEIYEEEYRIQTKHGEWKWILDRGKVFDRDKNGKALRAAGTHLDITQRKLINEKLKLKTKQLENINADLEQFAYIASHNLRGSVINLKSLLDLNDNPNLKESERKYVVEKMKFSVGQLQQTLDDLIDIVSLNKNVEDQIKELQFDEVLREVLVEFEEPLMKIEHNLTFDFSKARVVRFPESYLKSIFQNLISNAIKYRSEDRALKIDIRSKKQNDKINIRFSDNGLGIDLNKYGDKIFKIHQRFHEGKTGRGLGLYIINKQITQLGGSIAIDSEESKGTTFNLLLKNGLMR